MKRTTLTLMALFAGLALGSLASAQTPPAKKAPEPKPAKEAVAAKAEPGVALHFAVMGLTKDNLPKVKGSLSELSIQTFACAACKVEKATAGACPKCKAPLQATKQPLFVSVAPSLEEGSLALALDPRHSTRLSEIESTLAASAVQIDYAKMPLPGTLQLVVEGTAEQVAAVEKALSEAKLFEELHAAVEPSTGKIHVLARAGATPPTRASVAAALTAAKFQLSDVIFGRMPKKG